MAHITQPLPAAENSQKPGSTHTFALTSLTTLFFMWGFLTCLNDILIPYLKGMFSLNYTQAMLVQFCFFGAYFVMSIPAGRLVSKIGYQFGIVVGLVVAAI
ncbi:MAG: glucose/galactose MFS transporter, partial [Pseudoalteromonas tetraodonis]